VLYVSPSERASSVANEKYCPSAGESYRNFWAGRLKKRFPMALYVHLVKMTHQGASKIREMSST
jgi:hypothetical protein